MVALFKSRNFDGTAFYCQQAVEKVLKALILLKTKEKKTEGHSLIYLGKTAELPHNFFSGLKKLSPQYFISRYPDITESLPYENYDSEIAKEQLERARRIFKWLNTQMKE